MAYYLNKDGLTHLWSKLKSLLANKADSDHTHTWDEVEEKPTNFLYTTDVVAAAQSGNTAPITSGAVYNIHTSLSNRFANYVTKTELEEALATLNIGFAATEADMTESITDVAALTNELNSILAGE